MEPPHPFPTALKISKATRFSRISKNKKHSEIKKRTASWNTVQLCSSNIVFSFTCCICTRVFVWMKQKRPCSDRRNICVGLVIGDWWIGCCWKFIFRRAGPCASECAGMSCVSKRPVVSLATPCGWGLVSFDTKVWHHPRNEGQATIRFRRLV